MKNAAKIVVVGWSLFCLLGVVAGLVNVGQSMTAMNETERAGTSIGMGCGMGMWVGIWAAIALPAFLIYVLSGTRKPDDVPTGSAVDSRLCADCGKYYRGQPKFCPNCGHQTQ